MPEPGHTVWGVHDPQTSPDANDGQVLSPMAIGDPWPYAPEAVSEPGFRWLVETHNMLLMALPDVTEEMCEQISGPVDLALVATGPLVGVMVRFGAEGEWCESLHWRMPEQGVPDMFSEESVRADDHLAFFVVLVDSNTGIICHQRLFTASPHFTKMLAREARDRWAEGTDAATAHAAMDQWMAKHPSPKAALRESLARCHGGD